MAQRAWLEELQMATLNHSLETGLVPRIQANHIATDPEEYPHILADAVPHVRQMHFHDIHTVLFSNWQAAAKNQPVSE